MHHQEGARHPHDGRLRVPNVSVGVDTPRLCLLPAVPPSIVSQIPFTSGPQMPCSQDPRSRPDLYQLSSFRCQCDPPTLRQEGSPLSISPPLPIPSPPAFLLDSPAEESSTPAASAPGLLISILVPASRWPWGSQEQALLGSVAGMGLPPLLPPKPRLWPPGPTRIWGIKSSLASQASMMLCSSLCLEHSLCPLCLSLPVPPDLGSPLAVLTPGWVSPSPGRLALQSRGRGCRESAPVWTSIL